MTSRHFSSTLASLLIIILIAPSAFLIAPKEARARVFPTIELPGPLLGESTITAIKSTITAVAAPISAAAEVAQQINIHVLQPLAFALSGEIMKAMTAGVIAFVIGKTNATGIPQFVTDVQKSLQTAGDAKALAFFDQFGRNSNSPFAGSIVSSLRKDYLSKTSLAGFWAENMNTLAQSTPSYAPGYLTGNWSQGGVRAWFALTTQTQNNPYTFYPVAQAKLGSLVGPGVGGATGARIAELGWGNGFTSWCGEFGGAYTPGMGGSGVNPGDPCINRDGTAGTIKTPGSVIVERLNKALGADHDMVVRMGNVGPEINSILRNVGAIMQTVNFATQILGGPGSGGLFGMGQPSSRPGSASRLMDYQTPGYLGVTGSTVSKSATNLPSSGPDMLSRITPYEASWNTIRSAANAASTTVASLASFCIAQQGVARTLFGQSAYQYQNPEALASFISASTAQAVAAREAIATVIAPVLAQAEGAFAAIAAARALVQKVQTELSLGTSSSYALDIQTLQTMPPTASDVANVQQEARAFGMAAAIPAGSLNIAGGTIIDRMNLISKNAEELKTSVCTPTLPATISI